MMKLVRSSLLLATMALANAYASPLVNGNTFVPANELAGMQLLYELNVPGANPSYNNGTPVPYTINNAASILAGSYDRIGYYVEVTKGPQAGQFVYISMDTFDSNPAKLGLPHNVDNPVARQTVVSNANIFSNNTSIVTGTSIATAILEMWPSNYATGNTNVVNAGSAGLYDFNDSGFSNGAGHGSFQIHNFGDGALQTLFGWNDWGGNSPGQLSEFGIGNASLLGFAHSDWTFSDLGQMGFIQVLVGSPLTVPEPSSLALFAVAAAGITLTGRRRKSAV